MPSSSAVAPERPAVRALSPPDQKAAVRDGRTTRQRRVILAAFLPASALLLGVGQTLTPSGLDQVITSDEKARSLLPTAAAHSTQLYASNLLVLFGLGALGVAFSALAILVRGRGSATATTAALVGGFGALCGSLGNVLVGFNLAVAAHSQVPPEFAARYLASSFDSGVGGFLLVCYLSG